MVFFARMPSDVVMKRDASTAQHYLLDLLKNDLQRRGLLPPTAAEYCRQLRPLLRDRVDVTTLTRPEIVAWINERDTQSKRRFRWLAVKALFRMLVEDELVDSNPCEGVKMPKEQARPQPYVSDEDYERLLATCDGSFVGRRDRAIMTVLNSTGCRRSELVALRIADVDLNGRTVLIRRSKTGVGRLAYLDESSTKALLQWLRQRTIHQGDALAPSAPVWTTQRGSALGADAVRLMLHRRGRPLGIQVSPHQFRRRLAVNWHLMGGSPLGLMTAAGWSSPTMPARYAAQAAAEIAREEHRRLFG